MSFGLYMDVHVPSAITRGLRRRGVDVLSAQEDSGGRLEDPALLDRATLLGRIIFTRDEDFLAEGVRRLRAGERFSTIVYAHQQDVPVGRCIDDLEIIAVNSTADEASGRIVFLPL